MALTVTTSPTKLSEGSSSDFRQKRVKNTGATVLLVSKNSGMTASEVNSISIAAAGAETIAMNAGERLYGIVASGTTTVEVL